MFMINSLKNLSARAKAFMYRLILKRMGKNVEIHSGVKIFSPERVEMGDNVTIYENVLIYGGGNSGYVKMGDRSHIAPFSVINGEGGVVIGNKVAIGPGVKIYSISNTGDDHSIDIIDAPRNRKEIIIQDNVWIGANCVVVPGVKIGTGSIIGAGAVVIKDIPSNSVAVGVPAKVIRTRNADHLNGRKNE